MFAFIRDIFRDRPLQSSRLVGWQKRLSVVYNSRFTIPLLLVLGLVRALILILAYPPANGADHMDYFLHGAFLAGQNLPPAVANTVPLYPVLIAITYYGLGSLPLLVGLQLAMSLVEGTLYYIGLRRFSPAWAFVSALVITGDPQTGILYNFLSTEPLYLFLLASTFCVLLVQVSRKPGQHTLPGDIGLAALLFALTITRTVGRYLYLPLGILFLLKTRDWRRGVVLVVSFVGISLAFNALYQARVDALSPAINVEGGQHITNVNDTMVLTPLLKYNLLDSSSGTASATLEDYRIQCTPGGYPCMMERAGGQVAFLRLANAAYIEMLRARTGDYLQLFLSNFSDYLSMSGQQFRGTPTPIEVQCAEQASSTQQAVEKYINSWVFSGVGEVNATSLQTVIADIEGQVCPPLFNQPTIQSWVDAVALRYRSLGRPSPLIWYSALLVLVILIPWARRLWLPVFTAGVILVNHAALSALLVNVQPRYVVVTNPARAILLLFLLYVAMGIILRGVDRWLAGRPAPSSSETS